MKNLVIKKLKQLGLFSLMLTFIFSCNKEELESTHEAELEVIVEEINERFLKSEIIAGDEQAAFRIKNDGLIDEYVANERHFAINERLPVNRLIHCLVSTELTQEQTARARRLIMAYQNRNERLISNHRQAISLLKEGMELRRNYLIRQLRNGEIDQITFERKMTELRETYVLKLSRIKQTNANEFARSFRLLMQNLHTLLDAEQWQAFTSCIRPATP